MQPEIVYERIGKRNGVPHYGPKPIWHKITHALKDGYRQLAIYVIGFIASISVLSALAAIHPWLIFPVLIFFWLKQQDQI